MYGLDPATDFSLLIGAELIQVAIGRHQTILNFTNGITITVEAEAVRSRSGGRETRTFIQPIAFGQAVVELLGKTIQKATSVSNGTLQLHLTSGERLEPLDSHRDHESYSISGPGLNVIV